MIQISKATPDYFMSVAILLLEKAGKSDAFGRIYEDHKVRIRGNSDLSLVQVNANTIGIFQKGDADELIGEFKDGVATVTPSHCAFTNQLEWALSGAFKGVHLYEVVALFDDQPRTMSVIAVSLDDVERTLTDQGASRDLVRVIGIQPVPEMEHSLCVSKRVQDQRDLARKIEEARTSTDSVYVFNCYDAEAGPSRPFKKGPLQAVSLSDAEATVRSYFADGTLVFTEITIQTLLAYYTERAKSSYATPDMAKSIAVAARDA
ncbi:MAG: hypothetical protein EOP83_06470 [Verrucomicrobiaceae bacterium]|nr:MAG: hypothetical protein EOP83_06470 [Verrucomicrobiaceae bacterium]